MGLVAYDSSDEDQDDQVRTETRPQKPTDESSVSKPSNSPKPPPISSTPPAAEPSKKTSPPPAPSPSDSKPPDPKDGPELGPVLGPALGPSLPPRSSGPLLADEDPNDEVDMSFLSEPSTSLDPPKSPYTLNRTLLRDLSLPPVPNLSIPASPPGSPPPGLSALTSKFDNFLLLKRTKGIHFNQRLAANPGMRNPALTDRLLKFVGVSTGEDDDDGDDHDDRNGEGPKGGGLIEQYGTTLGVEESGWDPRAFPAWAYYGQLRKQNERTTRERERRKGERVEFVSAGLGTSESASEGGSVGGKKRGRV